MEEYPEAKGAVRGQLDLTKPELASDGFTMPGAGDIFRSMSTLAEIEAAAQALSALEKAKLLEFLAAELGRSPFAISGAGRNAGRTVGDIIGEDIGRYEGVPDLSTNPRYLDDLGV